MQLDQHSIVIVMMVVFSSTLLISAGLVLALAASAAGRLWAVGHVVLSCGGMMLAINGASTRWVPVTALAAGLYLVGKFIVYSGICVQRGGPGLTRVRAAAGGAALLALAGAAAIPDGGASLHIVGYALLALVSVATVAALLRPPGAFTRIGAPLALLACLVQLTTQVIGLSMALRDGAAVPPLYVGHTPAHALVMLAPLVAAMVGLFGYTLMAMEDIVAHQEIGASTDGLTGLMNRGALDKAAIALVNAWLRHRQPLACLVIDVDYFKQVNDRSGHRAGDAVLKSIAEALDNSRRASDVAGRYGGEEFCVLCPHTDETQATALANRILRKVRTIPLPGQPGEFASVSIGIAELHGERAPAEVLWQQLFGAADGALYIAKRCGRDRYAVASSLAPVLTPSASLTSTLAAALPTPAGEDRIGPQAT